MSLSAPKSPDPTATSNNQAVYNDLAARHQQALNSTNQTTPFGSLTYAADPNSPSGFSLNVALTPQQQALLNTRQATQSTLGGTAQDLASNTAGMYSAPPNLDPSAITNQLMNWQQSYIQPIFNQQSSNLEAQLRNQGLAPGSEAYNNAKNLLARNQGDITNQFFAQDEPLAFNQEVQRYQLPLQTISGLMSGAAPQGPTFQQAPQEQIQPPNYTGVAEQNYEQQNQAYGQTIAGLFGIPTALAGGWARGGFGNPFSGLFGGGGMFGGDGLPQSAMGGGYGGGVF